MDVPSSVEPLVGRAERRHRAFVRRSPAINGAKGRRAVVEHCKHRARAEGASYQEAECNLSADDK